MRHRKKGNHFGRTASHRKALMRNMAAQVIEHKEIHTTLAKAKELRSYVERLITYGKKGTVHHRRLAFRFLQNKNAVTSLFDEIAPAYEDRNGGYTRIIKLGNRQGDAASMSIIQLVGFEKIADKKKARAAKKDKKKAKEAQKATAEEQDASARTSVAAEEVPAVETEKSEQTPPADSAEPESTDEKSK